MRLLIQYRESVRRWLDIRRPDPSGFCVGTECAEPHTATHACRCSRTGEQTFRHDAVKLMLFDILRSVLRLAGVVMENKISDKRQKHADPPRKHGSYSNNIL